MKTVNTRSRLCAEHKEEVSCWRPDLRKRKQVTYTDDGNEEEEEEEDEDGEQPGPSTQDASCRGTRTNGLLSVTCGDTTGVLHTERLRRGQDCIECDGGWFTPPAFEDFGGKGVSKKWKCSILHRNKPLQFYFNEGFLTTKGYMRRSAKTLKVKKTSVPHCDSSTEDSDVQSADRTEEDDVREVDWRPSSEEAELETRERVGESAETENDDEIKEREETRNERTEDDETPAANDDNPNVCKGREKQLNISPSARRRLQMNPRIVIKRLPESRLWEETLLCEAQAEATRGRSGLVSDDPSVTAAPDASHTSDVPPVVGGAGKYQDKLTQTCGGKGGRREIISETGSSPRCLRPAVTSSPCLRSDILMRTEDSGSVGDHTADLSSTPQLLLAEINSGSSDDAAEGSWEKEGGELETGFCGRDEKMGEREAHVDESAREESRPLATVRVRGVATSVTETESSTSGHSAAPGKVPNPEESVLQTTRASDSSRSPTRVRSRCLCVGEPRLGTSELKRRKIEMQLEVLCLQQEYYTLRLKQLKDPQ